MSVTISWGPPAGRGDDRDAREHRFDDHLPERFGRDGRMYEDVHLVEFRPHVLAKAAEVDAVRNSQHSGRFMKARTVVLLGRAKHRRARQ